MTAFLLMAALAVVVIVFFVRGWLRQQHPQSPDKDLGTISHTWLAEQRLGRKDDMR